LCIDNSVVGEEKNMEVESEVQIWKIYLSFALIVQLPYLRDKATEYGHTHGGINILRI
jgi:hypothetical protein